jgi:hypothetical protein
MHTISHLHFNNYIKTAKLLHVSNLIVRHDGIQVRVLYKSHSIIFFMWLKLDLLCNL